MLLIYLIFLEEGIENMVVERQRVKEQDKIQRRSNFDPVESNLTPEQVKLEASRCLHCKNPRCVQGCPVNIQIPEFIKH